MPFKDPVQRFEDIAENICRIEEFTVGMDLNAFMADPKTYDAAERWLERISEAAIKLDTVAEDRCPSIPWALIRGVGNRLRHEYDRIDGVRIWMSVERDLPPLKTSVRAALQRLRGDEGQLR